MRLHPFVLSMLFLFIAGSAAYCQTLVAKDIGAIKPLGWGDYDNDGDMDLLQYNGTGLRILKNNLVGTTATFVESGLTLSNVNPSSVGWVDVNNDGYLDVYYTDGSLKFFINQGGASFSLAIANISGETLSTIADWGDIDNDGDLDIIGSGLILRNLGNNRFEVSQRFPTSGRTEFLDFENDGDLDFFSRDFLYTNKGHGIYELDRTISPYGSDGDYEYGDLLLIENDASNNKTFASRYKNNIGFTGQVTIWNFIYCGGGEFNNIQLDYLKIVDFDNDGKNDVLIYENGTINLYTSSNPSCGIIAALAVPPGKTEVADFDNDGDLDLFIGNNVFENKTVTANAAPSVPTGLASTVSGTVVSLSWSKATDDKTPATSLTYNLLIKRGPDVVVTKAISAAGRQSLAQRGNVEYNTSWKINNLPVGKYTWSVQALDEAFKPSAVSPERAFEVEVGPPLVTTLAIPTQYTSTYDDINDRYLLTFLKNGDLMGVWADGKTVQPLGSEFKINTSASSATSHVVGFNPTKNEFIISWLWENGLTKSIYAKNLRASGSNQHAEQQIYSRLDTIRVFLGGDKIAVDPTTGKYTVLLLQNWPDFSRPKTKFEDVPVTYFPFSLMDVFALQFSSSGTDIIGQPPKLLQTKPVPDSFITPHTINYTTQSAIEFDSKRKMYTVVWNFLGERRAGYGGGSSGEITSILRSDDLKLVVADASLSFKAEAKTGSGISQNIPVHTPRNLKLLYNSIVDQFILVWSGWQELTNGNGSDDYQYEVYQQIFALDNNGNVQFKNEASMVSNPPNILNYGSGLPTLSLSKKRNEYLIVWNKGQASGELGTLAEGDIFWRRVSPINYDFIDSDTRFLSGLIGNESIINYNSKYGHFLLGWRSSSKNLLSSFSIPKEKPPVVKTVNPNKAGVGTLVTITGSRFGNAAAINKVMFGSIPATIEPTVPSAKDTTEIKVRVPAGLTRDKVAVTVTYDDQVSNNTILFENVTETGISSVDPIIGQPGDLIVIKGTNFPLNKAEFLVKFGNVVATPDDIVENSTSQIKVKVPQHAVRGQQDLAVVVQEIANLYGQPFVVIRIPEITSIEPIDDNDTRFISDKFLDISGNGFSFTPGDVTITIGDVVVPQANITGASVTNLVIQIPRGIEGKQNVVVSTSDGDDSFLSEREFVVGGAFKDINRIYGDESDANAVYAAVKDTVLRNTSRSDDFLGFEMEVYNRGTVQELKFWTKGISAEQSAWTSNSLSFSESNGIRHSLREDEFPDDPVGLEAYYEAIDSSGVIKKTQTFRVFVDNLGSGETATIPDLRFGGNIQDYNIVSIPYKLTPDRVNFVLSSLFERHGYDDTQWRILHYKNSSKGYVEYQDGLDVIEPGKGYWLITRREEEIVFDIGRTLHSIKEGIYGPYEIELHQGWNQIGNPYDFNVSWDDIMDLNENPDNVESFKTFTNGAFVASGTIDRYRGGFVKYNGTGTMKLKIPFTNPGIGGRSKGDPIKFVSKLDEKEWRVALDLSAGQLKNMISSFGMHPRSDDGVDQRDEHKLPAFIQSLDLAFPQSLSTSIVGTSDHYTWDVEVTNTTDSKEVTLTWDNSSFGDNDRELYLQDLSSQRLIDMRAENHYTFMYNEGHNFKIHFGDKSYIEEIAKPTGVVLSEAYPNPMSSSTRIPFTVTKDRTHVRLGIYTLQGQELQTLVNDILDPGFYEFEWDGKGGGGTVITSGVVIYRLQASEPTSEVKSYFKKLVVTP